MIWYTTKHHNINHNCFILVYTNLPLSCSLWLNHTLINTGKLFPFLHLWLALPHPAIGSQTVPGFKFKKLVTYTLLTRQPLVYKYWLIAMSPSMLGHKHHKDLLYKSTCATSQSWNHRCICCSVKTLAHFLHPRPVFANDIIEQKLYTNRGKHIFL